VEVSFEEKFLPRAGSIRGDCLGHLGVHRVR
jgi:hypothetical protein